MPRLFNALEKIYIINTNALIIIKLIKINLIFFYFNFIIGVMRTKRRNQYVINSSSTDNENNTNNQTAIPSTSIQPNSSNNDLSSATTVSSTVSASRPAHGSINSLSDTNNHILSQSTSASSANLIANT